jgi:hypothetical protein
MDDGDLKILHEARLLTPGEFDAELHSRNLGTCMVVERPFPSRALDALTPNLEKTLPILLPILIARIPQGKSSEFVRNSKNKF